MVESEPDDTGRRTRDAWIDQQMRAVSGPPVRLMRDTIITGIGAGLATSLCGVLIRGVGWPLNYTIFYCATIWMRISSGLSRYRQITLRSTL